MQSIIIYNYKIKTLIFNCNMFDPIRIICRKYTTIIYVTKNMDFVKIN
jgi:hypothetical protein